MADRYWVGGSATWDATAGTKWSTTSGGAGGASVPGGNDNVFFDFGGTYTVTFGAGYAPACANFTSTSPAVTFAGTSPLVDIYGSFTIAASTNWTASASIIFKGLTNPTNTITTNGIAIGGSNGIALDDNGVGGSITLGGALTISGSVVITSGTFNSANYNITAIGLSSTNSNTRTINLGSSTVTLTAGSPINFSTSTNLTFNAGTSNIVCSSNALTVSTGSGVTFYNISFTNTTVTTVNINGPSTYNNFSVTAPSSVGAKSVFFGARQTINGTFSTTGTAGNRRVWFQGVTHGISQTLTINSAPSLTDADFRDIYVIGTSAPISGTRIGNRGGIRGITASTPKNVYWVTAAGGNWSGNNWAATSGGGASIDNFPLAQDTAVIENTGLNTSATVTVDTAMASLAMSGIDMSTRTNAMTLATGTVAPIIYGNWTNGSGTTLSGTGILTFGGRNTQTITSAGKTLTQPITVDSYDGTVQLADALNIGSRTLTVTNGIFDTKNYNVTALALSSDNSNVREIKLGSSTLTLSGTTAVLFTNTTNLTLTAGTSQINVTSTSGAIFTGGGLTFYNVSYTGTTSTTHAIQGANTFNNLTFTAPASDGLMQFLFNANQTINGTLTSSGATAVRRIFLRSDTIGTTRTLTVNSLSAEDCDFRDITIAGTAAGSSPTRAGDCGGNSGITFPAPKTVYWNSSISANWTATAWASTSGGAPDVNNYPLAQDTAVIDDAGGATNIFLGTYLVGTIDTSARTTAVNINFASTSNYPFVHGDIKIGSGATFKPSTTTANIEFNGRGTQTITSNGRAFGTGLSLIVNNFPGTVQLADALTVDASSLTLTSGTFDAVTFNVTVGSFASANSNARTLRMGSGTWTLSSTGTLWNLGTTTNLNFFKGTANIVLSSTSTVARTFTGGGLSYNKLTIGGTTGTSTLTINNDNQFTELASTKTVAHTIALGTTTQTFGKWTVTGTVGNVVTLTGSGTSHILAGACTSGIDYLAMGSIGFAATSPGEFYAGANSTGTAAAPVYRTAKPADSTRYWVGGTGNWSDTARWSTSSGGASGASVPRSHDDVVFNSASNATAYTATVDAVTGGIRMKSLTVAGPASGNLTLAGSAAMVGIHGNVTLPATGLTRTYTGAITLSSSSTGLTFTTNGVNLSSNITVNGVNCAWTLGSALNISTGAITITNGSLDFATYNVTANLLSSDNGNSRTLSMGSGTITLQGSNTNPTTFGTTETSRANLTLNAGTSSIVFNAPTAVLTGNNQTFYNVSFTTTSPSTNTAVINGANTFNNLSVTGPTSAGLKVLSLSANQTINGTLTLSAGTDATMRHFVQSDTLGTTRTLTCAAFSGTDADFRDITIAGAAAPVSGTRLGDCKGNSGITFDAPKQVYWNVTGGGNWSASNWSLVADGSGGSANNFPLAQDDAIFSPSYPSSGSTITVDQSYNIGTIDMSARTSNTMTLATGTTTPTIYGNWINGTGTTLSGNGTLTFAGRGSQTITSAGVTFTQDLIVNAITGSVTLQDSFITNRLLTLTSGTFDAAGYNTTIGLGLIATGASTRTLALGSGTCTIQASGSSAFTALSGTNLTVTGTGTISMTSASAKTFAGNGLSYSGITLNQGGAGALTISGNNTFKDITNTYSATGATNITLGTTTQTVTQWTATGTSGKVLTVQGTSASSPGTLILSGIADPNVDYLAITGVRAYSLTDTWYAGANSTNNGSLGWYFSAMPVPSVAGGNFFLIFG